MFGFIQTMLERADAGCQLWPHEISKATSLMFNTVYLLELKSSERSRADNALSAILAYANSRCVRELHALRHRDEVLRAAAHEGLGVLRAIIQSAPATQRVELRGLMAA